MRGSCHVHAGFWRQCIGRWPGECIMILLKMKMLVKINPLFKMKLPERGRCRGQRTRVRQRRSWRKQWWMMMAFAFVVIIVLKIISWWWWWWQTCQSSAGCRSPSPWDPSTSRGSWEPPACTAPEIKSVGGHKTIQQWYLIIHCLPACKQKTGEQTGGETPSLPGSGGSRTWQKYNQKSNLARDLETKIARLANVNLTLPSLLSDLLGEPSALFGVEHAQWQVGTIGAITIKL